MDSDLGVVSTMRSMLYVLGLPTRHGHVIPFTRWDGQGPNFFPTRDGRRFYLLYTANCVQHCLNLRRFLGASTSPESLAQAVARWDGEALGKRAGREEAHWRVRAHTPSDPRAQRAGSTAYPFCSARARARRGASGRGAPARPRRLDAPAERAHELRRDFLGRRLVRLVPNDGPVQRAEDLQPQQAL